MEMIPDETVKLSEFAHPTNLPIIQNPKSKIQNRNNPPL
jgi:hypothetical protein